MSLDIIGYGFIADENAIGFKKTDVYAYEEIFESAISSFFKNTLFISNQIVETNGLKIDYSIIFFPQRRRTYIIDRTNAEEFIRNNFKDFKILERSPLIYSFLIPFPNIDYHFNRQTNFGNSEYLVSINKFAGSTFKKLETYSVRLTFPETFDFRNNNFDPIFQKDFNSIYDIAMEYNNFFDSLFGIRIAPNILNKYILPFYELELHEFEKIDDIESKMLDNIETQMRNEADDEREELYQRWFDSEIDEMNREAFENDPDNIWNID